jgi:hypothetical protein
MSLDERDHMRERSIYGRKRKAIPGGKLIQTKRKNYILPLLLWDFPACCL